MTLTSSELEFLNIGGSYRFYLLLCLAKSLLGAPLRLTISYTIQLYIWEHPKKPQNLLNTSFGHVMDIGFQAA